MSERARAIAGSRTASAAILVAAATLALGAAPAEGAHFKRCGQEHLSSRDSLGRTLPVTALQVKRLSCSAAAAAVHASTFEATPGGPQFSTPGFTCSGPVGPPPPQSRPRNYRCARGTDQFEFLIPGFS